MDAPRIILPEHLARRLEKELHRAGTHEIGGILMGARCEEKLFRIENFTIQGQGGSIAFFVRRAKSCFRPLLDFFAQTNHEYQKFNYLGEWHSHPNFSTEPSATDTKTMQDIVTSPEVGAHFAVLMIIRIGPRNTLEGSVHFYLPDGLYFRGTLEIEPISFSCTEKKENNT